MTYSRELLDELLPETSPHNNIVRIVQQKIL
jgi:hypothetical protein